MDEKRNLYCEKCGRTMSEIQFYSSLNKEKYPTGKLNQCKKCISMHVDNWNPDTYLWILQECDVPYVPEEWNKLLATYSRDGKKITGLTILGRYLAKMRLNQFKDYRWKDTEFLKELQKKKIEETMKDQGYSAQEIATAINKATVEIPDKPIEIPVYADDPPVTPAAPPPPQPLDYTADPTAQAAAAEDLGLTEDDITYLRIKWGKTYKPDEWIQLEKLYEEMKNSYDIQGAAHEDNLKLLCKTSLKANQLIDIGDIEGFQKMSKVYDTLMKSGKFSAAQNKAEQGEFVDSVSELVALCEKDGFIPRYYVTKPNDKVDETLKDMQQYTRNLILGETNLSQLLEGAIKTVEKEEASADKDEDDEDIFDFDDDSVAEVERELKDHEEFTDFEEENEINDQILTDFLINGKD